MQYRFKQITLLIGDALCLLCGLSLALFLRRRGILSPEEFFSALYWFAILFPIMLAVQYINGTYDIRGHRSVKTMLPRLVQSGIANVILGIMFFYLIPRQPFSPKTILLLTVSIGYLLIIGWRAVFLSYVAASKFLTRVLFVGNAEEMDELAALMRDTPTCGFTLAAWICDNASEKKAVFPETTYYASTHAIRPAVTVHNIDMVVMAPEVRAHTQVEQELYQLLFWNVTIRPVSSLYETLTGRIPPSTFSEAWFLDHLKQGRQPVYEHLRRAIDIVVGFVLSICLILFFLPIAIAIRLSSSGSLFFKQQRVGHANTTFLLYKFRSMYVLSDDGSAEQHGVQFATKGDTRITPVGKFLRKTRLDELPQAINLLRGDISLIGPRPERPEIVGTLEEQMSYYAVRHIIKPGITGWAQVNQHYTETLEQSLQKLQYDLYYIKNRSILLDLSIVLKTINVVLRGMGQ